ncbi:MAG TPA: APC family permease [Ktedonobacterales bacterium]
MSVSTSSARALRRVLPFRSVVSTSTGLAYAAISLLACVQLAAFLAGDSAWIALLVAGGLAVLAAFCFSELNALYPSAAAIRQYIRAAFGERASLTIAFGYVVTIVAVIAADSYVVGSAISFVFPQTPTLLWIVVILGLAVAANLLGIRMAGLLQDISTYTLLVSLAAISLLALAHGGFHLHTPFAALQTPGNLFNAVAVGVFVFSAFEWVTPLAEEISDTTQIPRGMFFSLGLLFISYALFTVACTNLVGIDALCQHIGAPNQTCSAVPQMLLGQALGPVGSVMSQIGIYWMLAATLLTGVMTFNGGFATASRFLYAAAREATLPEVFARLSVRLVPWVTVVTLAVASGVIAVVIAYTKEYNTLILVGAVLEAAIYAVAGFCVIRLRVRQPDAARSFRIPFGWMIPLLTVAIFAALGIAAAVVPTPLPLAITLVIFAASFAYVWLEVPRLKAAAEAKRRAVGTRRPRRPALQSESAQTEAPAQTQE